MTRTFLRRSMFSKVLLRRCGGKILAGAACLLAAVCLHAPVALAQHGGGGHFGGGNFGGGGVHTSASRGARAPAAKTSSIFHMFRRTAADGKGSSAAAAPITTPVTLNSSGFLLSPRPTPTPTPQPVFFVPVYFGSPFFYGLYGGFNSFGWGCGSFWGAGCFYSPFYGYGSYGYGYGGYYGGSYGSSSGGYTGASTGSSAYSSSNPSDPSTTPAQSYASSTAPSHRSDLVELHFKDGTVYDVTDYWQVDGQLHFLTVDESGSKNVEHVVPFDTLDVQTTTDDNANRGFKFQVRNQSMEQYFREHPEDVPKVVDPDAPQN